MYRVMFVKDEDLPEEHSWAMARDMEGNCYAFIKRSRVTPCVLEEAWAGFRRLAARFRMVA